MIDIGTEIARLEHDLAIIVTQRDDLMVLAVPIRDRLMKLYIQKYVKDQKAVVGLVA